MYDLIVVGGGAAGFFTAIQLAEQKPKSKILILEKSGKYLSKVKVSGGGRCNVTHACFIPHDMVENYPRGEKELLGPYHRFMSGDMMEWLGQHGVETKMEEDGRVFPVSNSSQTIIDCFMACCAKHRIQLQSSSAVTGIHSEDGKWTVRTASKLYHSRNVMMATGSTPSMWKLLGEMEYEIVEPVPSLFTFNIKNKLLDKLPGLGMPNAQVKIKETGHESFGPLLITHWGLSGPGILKLSAWAAQDLNILDYKFTIIIDWIDGGIRAAESAIENERHRNGKRMVKKYPMFSIPRRLWERFCFMARLGDTNFASMDSEQIDSLSQYLGACELNVKGKSTFKEEFVTCGGVERKQIDFKTMQSKLHPGLYMAGEVIDIDAITGGFNFQAAWTEGFIAAEHLASQERVL